MVTVVMASVVVTKLEEIWDEFIVNVIVHMIKLTIQTMFVNSSRKKKLSMLSIEITKKN